MVTPKIRFPGKIPPLVMLDDNPLPTVIGANTFGVTMQYVYFVSLLSAAVFATAYAQITRLRRCRIVNVFAAQNNEIPSYWLAS